jgi:hypothetical protein
MNAFTRCEHPTAATIKNFTPIYFFCPYRGPNDVLFCDIPDFDRQHPLKQLLGAIRCSPAQVTLTDLSAQDRTRTGHFEPFRSRFMGLHFVLAISWFRGILNSFHENPTAQAMQSRRVSAFSIVSFRQKSAALLIAGRAS